MRQVPGEELSFFYAQLVIMENALVMQHRSVIDPVTAKCEALALVGEGLAIEDKGEGRPSRGDLGRALSSAFRLNRSGVGTHSDGKNR